MKKQKKDPLYKSFGYAICRNICSGNEGTEYEDSLCGNGLCGDRRIRISYYTGRVVYLPDIVWSGHGIGNGEYGSGSSGRSGHGREKAACKACQRCCSRSSTDRGNHGSNCRDDHIYSKAFWKACLYRHRKENDLWKN